MVHLLVFAAPPGAGRQPYGLVGLPPTNGSDSRHEIDQTSASKLCTSLEIETVSARPVSIPAYPVMKMSQLSVLEALYIAR
jgi:hypothetical protein